MKHCNKTNSTSCPDIIQLDKVEGCVNGVAAYREDTILNGVRTEGDVVTQSPVTGEFIPFPCSYVACSCCPDSIEYSDCCCNTYSIDPSITGGWSNQLEDCSKCLDGNMSFKWTQCVGDESSRSYTMRGLSDTCGDSASFQEIDFAFYHIIRHDVGNPYNIVYIYESGANRGWYSYTRQFKKLCIDFEIRRVGGNIEYYIDGDLVRTTTDTTGGACLYPDSSEHGSLNNFTTNTINTTLCQTV